MKKNGMKKLLYAALVAVMAVTMAACGGSSGKEPESNQGNESKTPGMEERNFKIGIMAHSVTYGEENYRTSCGLQEKYGKKNVLVDTYPDVVEQETVISKVLAMAADPDVKAILFNVADSGTIAAINALKEVRDDIVTICGNPVEDVEQLAAVADLLLMKDHTNLAKNMVAAAKDQGCTTFVHYSFPRHMSSQVVAQRAGVFKAECESAGIKYIEVTTPDPMGDSGVAGTQQFILEDVPLEVEKYGKDVCFFGTQSAMFEPLVKSVCSTGAMYFGQSDPTCIDAFPGALGIVVPEDKIGDLDYMHEQIEKKVTELGMNGRLGTWKQSVNGTVINCGFNIGSAYAAGEITAMNDFDYISELIQDFGGDGTTVTLYQNGEGKTIDNVVLYCCATKVY